MVCKQGGNPSGLTAEPVILPSTTLAPTRPRPWLMCWAGEDGPRPTHRAACRGEGRTKPVGAKRKGTAVLWELEGFAAEVTFELGHSVFCGAAAQAASFEISTFTRE